jgi:hypothetical protein
MAEIKIRTNIVIAFVLLILAIISAYFLISIELSDLSTTTTLPKVTTLPTTTRPPTTSTTTTTLPASLREHLVELANENIQGECNITYTGVERKHLPTSVWFTDLCPDFKDLEETEKWRTSAYLNDMCNPEQEDGCIEILTSISLGEELICVWAINHFNSSMVNSGNLTQKYC